MSVESGRGATVGAPNTHTHTRTRGEGASSKVGKRGKKNTKV